MKGRFIFLQNESIRIAIRESECSRLAQRSQAYADSCTFMFMFDFTAAEVYS